MAIFEKAIEKTLKHEGGLVDHPSDPGGLTNMGITWTTFGLWAARLGLPKTRKALVNLSKSNAIYIYRHGYWNRLNGNNIKSQSVAEIYFDAFVNSGNTAVVQMQTAVSNLGEKIKIDGIHGPKTLGAINYVDSETLFYKFKAVRERFYRTLAERKPAMKVFLKGWLNRINTFEYDS
jgi:type VI secretion system secreted protein VgrG